MASEVNNGPGWRAIPLQDTLPQVSTAPTEPADTKQQQSSLITSKCSVNPIKVNNIPQSSFNCPVSGDCLKIVDTEFRQVDEFKYLTYTPIFISPEEYASRGQNTVGGYSLRQNRNGRKTELLIAVTMYNESDEFLIRTLNAVFKNIRYLNELNKPSSIPGTSIDLTTDIGSDNCSYVADSSRAKGAGLKTTAIGDGIWTPGTAWQKVVVCLISDGRSKIHPRVKRMLQAMGVFQEELIMPEFVDSGNSNSTEQTRMHLFESTSQTIMESDFQMKSGSKHGVVPVQFMFCLKETNAKKLNSHKWLFRAFAPLLNPRVCVLLDVGTRPKSPDAIYRLWRSFDRGPDVGAAAGEICVMLGKNCAAFKSTIHPLIACQNFEYKMSNILDKTLESCFGYISVLPGAFSAYRWEALQDTDPDNGPLVSYFKGETPKPKGNVFAANQYLAEDRILALSLVMKRHSRWLLHYVKDAQAETDVPTSVPEFISQRRRWINGTFFCQVFAVWNWRGIWNTRHSFARKLALTLQFFYLTVSLVLNWFTIGNYYLFFYLLTAQSFKTGISSSTQDIIFYLLRTAYMCIMVAIFICSMGNRPQGATAIYVGSMVMFAIITVAMLAVTAILVYQSFSNLSPGSDWFLTSGTSRDILIAGISTYGLYIASSLLYGQFLHMITCLLQYLLLLPSYINTLCIYAFCNSHDVSWGTKGDNKTATSTSKKGPDNSKANEVIDMKPTLSSIKLLSMDELDKFYREAVKDAQTPPLEEVETVDPSTRKDDYYRNFRTWFVLSWAMSNGLLVAIVSSPTVSLILVGDNTTTFSNPYMQFIMYSIAGFALIRFIGCVWYLVLRARRKY